MIRIRCFLILGVMLGALSPLGECAEGLSTSFSDVFVRGVPSGQPYVVSGPSGKGLVLKNLGNTPIRVKVQALVPTQAQLKDGAIPISETAWVRLDPDELILPARGEGIFQITLIVPRSVKRHEQPYQIMIWTRGAPMSDAAVSVSPGLLSRLRFTIEK